MNPQKGSIEYPHNSTRVTHMVINSIVIINTTLTSAPLSGDQGLYPSCRSFEAPLLSKRKVDDTTIKLRYRKLLVGISLIESTVSPAIS